jgi:hypothetical protein
MARRAPGYGVAAGTVFCDGVLGRAGEVAAPGGPLRPEEAVPLAGRATGWPADALAEAVPPAALDWAALDCAAVDWAAVDWAAVGRTLVAVAAAWPVAAGRLAGAVDGPNVATESMAPATRHTARMLASSGMTVPGPPNGAVTLRSRVRRRSARCSRW